MALQLTRLEAEKEKPQNEQAPETHFTPHEFFPLGKGRVKFFELDAEKMGDHFAAGSTTFDAVWICEALSHFPNKALFFENAHRVLKKGGKLAIADWFKAEDLDDKQFANDIKPIEGEWTRTSVPHPCGSPPRVAGWITSGSNRRRQSAWVGDAQGSGVTESMG